MNNKLIIENREFYFHPRYIAYAGSLDGYVVHAVTRIPTSGIINSYLPRMFFSVDYLRGGPRRTLSLHVQYS